MQKDAILDHLKSGRSITGLEALRLYGSIRLAARIEEFIKQGFPIKDEWFKDKFSGKRYKKYSLSTPVKNLATAQGQVVTAVSTPGLFKETFIPEIGKILIG